eukprot:g5818.t1
MEGDYEEEEENIGPIYRIQKRLNESNIPINVTNNFTLNLIAGGAIVMYWGAMWNILDRYFLKKRVPNVTANSLLRIALGLGLLAFQDNDIKEIGDNYDGIEEEEEEEPESAVIVDQKNLADLVAESVFLASRGYSWCGDNTSISRDQIESIFRRADKDENKKLEGNEIAIFREHLLLGLQAQAEISKSKKKDEEEKKRECSNDTRIDRFRDLEEWLETNGMSLNLHHEYFQNIWLGTGIITVWSGMENLFNAIFGFRGKILGHVLVNNVSRLCLAAFLLYLPGGNLNDIGDGYLEDDEEEEVDHAELHRQELEMCILNAVRKDEKALSIIGSDEHASITLGHVLDAYDRLDVNNDGSISTRELILSLAKDN